MRRETSFHPPGRKVSSKSTWPVRSLPLLELNTGTMKFTSYEAQAIEPLVSNSPFQAWMHQVLSVRAFCEFSRCSRDCNRNPDSSPADLGTASAIGSLLAVAMFFMTLSFMITKSPTWEASTG